MNEESEKLFRELVDAGRAMRATAIVDDDFPASLHVFDARLRDASAHFAPKEPTPIPSPVPLTHGKKLYVLILQELDRAYAKHGTAPWSRHEFFGVLKEEVDELWEDIKDDAPQSQLMEELVQVAAMCFRYFETGDRNRGPHPTI